MILSYFMIYMSNTCIGKTYYYNMKTKESTWTKPMELCNPSEQEVMIRRKEETLKFFHEMEANIKAKFTQTTTHTTLTTSDDVTTSYSDHMDSSTNLTNSSFQEELTTRSVRTISAIEDNIFEILNMNTNISNLDNSNISPMATSVGDKFRRHSSYVTMESLSRSVSMDFDNNNIINVANQFISTSTCNPISIEIDTSNSNDNPRTNLKRRNSSGTIYVGTTMSIQDNEATIKCVCIVIRAHIIESYKTNRIPESRFILFHDPIFNIKSKPIIPSIEIINQFFTLVFEKSQLESECIIMALIYCERLMKETNGGFCICYNNWKSIIFACLIMSSKVWDDLSMWNIDFSQVSDGFDLKRINALELAILEALNYIVKVSASEYAKYYFHLRSMMTRLGMSSEDCEPIPLDIEGAKRLQLATEKFQDSRQSHRSNSMSISLDTKSQILLLHESNVLSPNNAGISSGHSSDDYKLISPHYPHHPHHAYVGLEQLIHNEHTDGDGVPHHSMHSQQSNKKITRLSNEQQHHQSNLTINLAALNV